MKRIRFRSLGSLGRAAVDRRLVPFNPFQLDYWLRADQSDPDDQNTQPEEKLIAIIRFCSVSLGRIVYSQDNSAAFFFWMGVSTRLPPADCISFRPLRPAGLPPSG